MRNPDRITPTLEAVERYWRTRPDMRLGQLMWSIAGGDPFHIEEREVLHVIKKELDNGKSN